MVTIPKLASDYQVILYDITGTQVAIFDDWIALSIEHSLNRFSTHQFSFNGLDDRKDLFTKDCLLEVKRRSIGLNLNWYTEYIGLHRTPQRQITSQGRSIFTSYGRGLLDLIRRRGIAHYANSTGSNKSGPAETVIKEFVDENAGPGAVSPPRLRTGTIPGLSVQADAGLGAVWTGARAYHNLLEIISEIAGFAGLVFTVTNLGGYTFRFDVSEPEDRTNTGIDPLTGLNASGNIPIVFNPILGNLTNPSLTDSATEEITVAIILGQGQEDDRAFAIRTSAATGDSPLNDIEDIRDARQESTAAGLNTRGDELLEEMQSRENFHGEIVQIPSIVYGRDYFLSDLVTVQMDDIVRNKQVTEVRINVSEGNENITIELGDLS